MNGLSIPHDDVLAICAAHPQLTGRDVKNLLKLASFISKKEKVTKEHVELALQFKPA